MSSGDKGQETWPRRGAAFGEVRSLLVNLREFLGYSGMGDRTQFLLCLERNTERGSGTGDLWPFGLDWALGREPASGKLLTP